MQSPSSSRVLTLAGIGLSALIVRTIILHFFSHPPFADQLWNDAVGWNLARRVGFTASAQPPYIPGAFRPPGYPLFLALIYSIFGHHYFAAQVGNAVLDSITAVLTACLAQLLLAEQRVAVLSGLVYALYPYSALLCCELTQDILLTAMIVVAILITIAASRRLQLPRWMILGAWLGAIGLVKPFLLLFIFVPFSVLLCSQAPLPRKIFLASSALLCTLLVITPWMIRNYMVFHDFQPLAAGATGEDLQLVAAQVQFGDETIANRQQLEQDFRGAPQSNSGIQDGPALITEERQMAHSALQYLAQHKAAYALTILRHIPREWLTLHLIGGNRLLALPALILSAGFLILGIVGMSVTRHRWRLLLPIYATVVFFTLAHAPVQTESRYVTPARPAMAIFIALALHDISLSLSRKHRLSQEPVVPQAGSASQKASA